MSELRSKDGWRERGIGMKFIETDMWCFGLNDEIFYEDFLSKEDAIKYAKDCDGGYIGRAVKIRFDEEDVCYDETGYLLQQQLYDEIGDASDNWVLSREQELELSEILAKAVIDYINKNNLQPNCYKVVDIEEITVDGFKAGEQE